MYLGAGAARPRVAHFPEIVVFVAVDDMVGGHVLGPIAGSLVVALQSFFLATLEYGNIQVGGVQFQHLGQVFPCHVDGTLFEVVAEAPVAEHLEHGVVVSVVSHLFEVVVLAAHTETFLRIYAGYILARVFRAENDVFPLVHTCVCKHQRGVILDDHRG